MKRRCIFFKVCRIHRHQSFGVVATKSVAQRLFFVQLLKVLDFVSGTLNTLCAVFTLTLTDGLFDVTDFAWDDDARCLNKRDSLLRGFDSRFQCLLNQSTTSHLNIANDGFLRDLELAPVIRAALHANTVSRLVWRPHCLARLRVNDWLPHARAKLRMVLAHHLIANTSAVQDCVGRLVLSCAVFGEDSLALVVLIVEASHHLLGFHSASTDPVTQVGVDVLQGGQIFASGYGGFHPG